jgi:endonuclease/exonuclease/phosphatase family metal-dependent hydrolase
MHPLLSRARTQRRQPCERRHPRRDDRRQWRRVLLGSILLVVACACAATNYPEASGPLYTGRYGESRSLRSGADSPGSAPAPLEPTSAQDVAPPASAPLRVVTFNIAFALQIDSALAVLRQAAPLRRPDFLALQEMDAPSVERIAATLGMNYIYYPSGLHPRYGRDFGCAVLSPWPLEEPRKIVMPQRARFTGLTRVITVATLRRGAQRFRVYAVHLPSPMGISKSARREQLKVLLADALASPDPVILAGDFNSEAAGEAFERSGFVWPTRNIVATTRFLGVGFRYDHVLARGLRLAGGDSTVGVVEENRAASDHCPVWALLDRE